MADLSPAAQAVLVLKSAHAGMMDSGSAKYVSYASIRLMPES
jgi:hypothetical protein